jgi:hypothetical protein
MFATGAARRIGAAALVILAALGSIGEAVDGGKSGDAKKHSRSNQRNH